MAAMRRSTPPRCAACCRAKPGPYRDAVLFNAAAALLIAGEVETLADGAEEAAEAIDKGLANALLNCWIDFTKAVRMNKLEEICAVKRIEVERRKG